MKKGRALEKAVKILPTCSFNGTVIRLVKYEHINAGAPIMSSLGSRIVGGRYNEKNTIDILYFANTHKTACLEVFGSVDTMPTDTYMLLSIDLNLSKLVDLCSRKVQNILNTDRSELTSGWKTTQILGNALFHEGSIQGLLCPSSKNINGKCLNVFIDFARLNKGDYIRINRNLGGFEAI